MRKENFDSLNLFPGVTGGGMGGGGGEEYKIKRTGGARQYYLGVRKRLWHLSGCSASKGTESGSFSVTFLGIEQKKEDTVLF